ncbi:MAG: helix-turn-helix domain-containing protein [Aeromicrobium sp.]
MIDRPRLPDQLVAALFERVPGMAEATVTAVVDAVPEYRRLFGSSRGDDVRHQIEIAMSTFFRLVSLPSSEDDALLRPAIDGARAMGENEARAGRGTEAVLNAFRVGGRSTWDGIAAESARQGLSGEDVAMLAGLLFDYVDRISAATVTGHQEELNGLVRTRDLERDALVRSLLTSGVVSAEQSRRAEWPVPPRTVLVLVPSATAPQAARLLPPGSIIASGSLPGGDKVDGVAVVVVPQADVADRSSVLARLSGFPAVVAPSTATDRSPTAYGWALDLWGLAPSDTVDADLHLPEALLRSDPDLVALMRQRLLAPLAALPPATRHSLETTLAWWLRNHGRQDRVAAEVFVHAQTVRYRLGRLHELLGDSVHDPALTLPFLMCLTTTRPSLSAQNGTQTKSV